MVRIYLPALLAGASIFSLMMSTTFSFSQDVKAETLDTVVVTASRTEQTLMDVTRSIQVIDQETIKKANVESVAELLRDIPGVKLVDSAVAGMKRVSIRGEEAIRNVVLIDGQEVTDHTTYGPLFLIDPSQIERIEVLKGPSSVLHGSKAIGGVVNIITKKGADKPLSITLGTAFDSSTNGVSGHASVAGTLEKFDYRLSLSKARHGDRRTANGTLKGSGHNNQSFSGYVGYTHENHKIALRAERYELDGDVYVNPASLGLALSRFDMKLPKRDRTKVGVFYEGTNLNDWVSRINFDAYFQQVDRRAELSYRLSPPRSGMTVDTFNTSDDKQKTFGLNGQVDLTLLKDNLTIVGFQYMSDQVNRHSTRTGSQTIALPPPRPTIVRPIRDNVRDTSTVNTFSVFAQNEWSPSDDFSLTAGGRYYYVSSDFSSPTTKRSSSDQAFIGSVGINYTGIDDLSLRAHLSQGYVYPTLLQSMTGSFFSPAGVINPNPNLKPETSITAEIGARFDNGRAMLDISAYYTDAKNYISSVSCTATPLCATPGESIYVNINSAKTYGLEIAGSYKFEEWGLTPYANLTIMRRRFARSTGATYKTDTPLFSGRVGLRKDWAFDYEGLTAFTDLYVRAATEHEEQGTRSVSREPAYATLNLAGGLTYKMGKGRTLRINAAVENIFDKAYSPSVSELPAPGRTFKLSTTITF